MKKLFLFVLLAFPLFSFAQLHLLNDEFDDASSLSDWQNINDVEGWGAEQLEEIDVNTTYSSKLMMMPYTSAWFNEYRGTLIFKEVTGDFVFTTEVTATNRAETGIPSSDYSLAGAMIRIPRPWTNGAADWTANSQDYVFLSMGQANDGHPDFGGVPTPGPHFEVKTTTNSGSILNVSSISTNEDVQVRLAKVGDYVICLNRIPGGSWEVHRRYTRTDFPATMQVGFVTYTDWPKVDDFDTLTHNTNVLVPGFMPDPTPMVNYNPDLIGSFEFARFGEVTLPAALVGVDLEDEMAASDADLLAFLGYDSEPHITSSIDDLNTVSDIQVYPNPVADLLNIKVDESLANDVTIEVIDANGKLLIETAKTRNIDVSNLSKGLYIIKLHKDNEPIKTMKFSKH